MRIRLVCPVCNNESMKLAIWVNKCKCHVCHHTFALMEYKRILVMNAICNFIFLMVYMTCYSNISYVNKLNSAMWMILSLIITLPAAYSSGSIIVAFNFMHYFKRNKKYCDAAKKKLPQKAAICFFIISITVIMLICLYRFLLCFEI